ncbi:MAG: PspC domain-containing protein, partial [Maribacter sp.]
MRWIYDILYYFQKRGFEVCRRIAERWGIRARVVRTTFIYLTFATLGFGF